MTDIAKKKEDMKKQLRALLLSAPTALTVREIKRDYEDFVGDPIPFRKMGYTTIEDMMKDMDDAFRITWKNGTMCVQPVAQASSVHIQNLVSKQKVTNKKKWATLRPGGPTNYNRNRLGPMPPPRYASSPQYNYKPTVPAFVRRQIDQLLKSYTNGLPLTHFDTAFSKRFGSQICYKKLGFQSMRSLLETIPYTARIKDFQGGEVRVISISYNDRPPPNPQTERHWRADPPKQKPEEKSFTNYYKPSPNYTQPSSHNEHKESDYTQASNQDLRHGVGRGKPMQEQQQNLVPRGRGMEIYLSLIT